jgi:hypothetical protein
MVQRGRRLRLTRKACQRPGILCNFVGQELQSYKAMKPSVFGLIDHTHAAATKFFNDAVVLNYLVDHSEEMRLPGREARASQRTTQEYPRVRAPPFVRSREAYIVVQFADRLFALNAVDFPSS